MNAVFAHDGSFPGFLCAVAELLNERRSGRNALVRRAAVDQGLFEERLPVPTDEARARALVARFRERFGEACGRIDYSTFGDPLETAFEAFNSDIPKADEAAAVFLAELWEHGSAAVDRLDREEIWLTQKAAQRTRHEAHIHKGIVRFGEVAWTLSPDVADQSPVAGGVGGLWYAAIRPECSILPLLGPHFAARYSDMRWIIHDKRRGEAVIHAPGQGWRLVSGFSVEGEALVWSAAELELRSFWREYFHSVAIAERENPELQRNFLPLKYREDMPEFQTPEGEADRPPQTSRARLG